ncbi:AhpC/TSA family protein [Fulvivirga sp. M361]|uniref:TlpA disulfide reductase family protein n=1 Tax=Fulvivirga sp. M361 TaxID=2594266 RepID=UPI00117AC7C5|nr:TlpA disulfide reductase family protein [Fulvivirga sp. M361]TRX52423.1 AhpC/TSA family protein [Fulvivirga sp. M361]
MKRIGLLYFILVLATSCQSGAGSDKPAQDQTDGNYITLSGTVGYPQEGLILLEAYQGAQNITTVVDTLLLDDATYKFSERVLVDKPGYYKLNFYNKQAINLILHKDDVEIKVDGNAQNGFAQITGSSEYDFIKDVQGMNQAFQSSDEIQELNKVFMEANQAGDMAKMDELRGKYLQMESEFKKDIIARIEQEGPSLGVLEILRGGKILDRDKNFDVYLTYAELLKTELPNSEIAQEFVMDVEQMKSLAVGQVAPDIALPNPEGTIVSLSSLRGNYVLVDFWAKWCKPCRMENPNVVKMYKKYNEKGFEVFGVSLDRRREDWIRAIEEDQLHWTQVSDLKYWQSEAAQLYNVTAIPFALLLDPDGRIIGKNLRGRQLEDKLEEIFGKG